MNIRDIKYLVAVAETKHFGRAAQKCFVSQPTLSAQLKKLEEELGVQVFERNQKQVQVTAAGESIIKQARCILGEIDQLTNMAQEMQDPLSGTLRVGIIPSLAPYLLPKILPALQEKFPTLNIVIDENQTDIIVEKLKQGGLDAIILALPVPNEGLETTLLFNEPFFAAVPSDHKLASQQTIKLSDLENEDLLLLSDGHCLRDQALEACQFSGAKAKPGFEATSIETLRHLVAAGMGVTLLPKLAVNSLQQSNVSIIDFSDDPKPSRQIGMLWRSCSARKICCEAVAEEIKSQFTL